MKALRNLQGVTKHQEFRKKECFCWVMSVCLKVLTKITLAPAPYFDNRCCNQKFFSFRLWCVIVWSFIFSQSFGNHSFIECWLDEAHWLYRVRIVLDITSLPRVLLHFPCIMAEKLEPTADDRKKKAWMKKNENLNLGIFILYSNHQRYLMGELAYNWKQMVADTLCLLAGSLFRDLIELLTKIVCCRHTTASKHANCRCHLFFCMNSPDSFFI